MLVGFSQMADALERGDFEGAGEQWVHGSAGLVNTLAVAAVGLRAPAIQTEVYTLRALKPGFYPVMKRGFRQPQGGVWLNKGGIWKIGETSFPRLRYSQRYLDQWNLLYQSESVWSSKGLARAQEGVELRLFKGATGELPPGNKILK
jgi:hypothetical protein